MNRAIWRATIIRFLGVAGFTHYQATELKCLLLAMSIEKPIVFVIDDDHSVREAVGSLLRSIGLEVRAFEIDDRFSSR